MFYKDLKIGMKIILRTKDVPTGVSEYIFRRRHEYYKYWDRSEWRVLLLQESGSYWRGNFMARLELIDNKKMPAKERRYYPLKYTMNTYCINMNRLYDPLDSTKFFFPFEKKVTAPITYRYLLDKMNV